MQLEAIGFVLGAALFWAIASQLEPEAMKGFGVVSFRAMRAVIAVVLMATILGITAGTAKKNTPHEMLKFKPEAKAVWLAIAVAILTTLAGLFYYFALVKTDNKATTVIGVSTPMTLAFSALIGVVFFAEREKLTAVQWWGIVLAVCSVGMISWNQKMGKSEAVKVSPSPN